MGIPQNKGGGVYLQRKGPLFFLGQTWAYLGLNLIQLDLRLDVNFQVGADLWFAINLRVEASSEFGLEFVWPASPSNLAVGSTWESILTWQSISI